MCGKGDKMRTGTLVLCVILLGLNLWQLRQLSDLREALQSAETNLQMETRRLDERVQAVQRAAGDADKLVQDWEFQSLEVDPASRCLRAKVFLQLKEWQEDTQVRLTVVQGSETREAVMSGEAGQYTGTAEIPVNSQALRLLANVSAGGFQKEEDLFAWDSASMLLPVQCSSWGYGGPEYVWNADKTGVLTVTGCDANLTGFEGKNVPQLSGQVFRLRRNEEIAAEKTAMFGETIDQYTCGELSAEVRLGDQILLTFFCRDEFGLGYEFFLDGWIVREKGVVDSVPNWTRSPRLTWS
ncbi:MAG: hypothetical protein HFG00_05475 [Oscillibacter sp.]|nr:hypothetical protein [Oscillibacter sp.]